ncbi:unnamed protein product [Symbiodinium pilosum]|uniref:Uncharacterized protein n=1 Tax=Symbiodinium pilosum TaxID=2952 RepID=A0A812X5Q9_SYMPI|nr:unnamed protein product [Symbiodinium pilosum]
MSCNFDTDCPDGKIACILTYNGCGQDIAINYALLATQAPAFYMCAGSYTVPVFAFFAIFQVVLCMLAHCSGVSVVWCAILGYCGAVAYKARYWTTRKRTHS